MRHLVIKFKYEIHCQMAMENQKFIETIGAVLSRTDSGKQLQIIGVPEDQWLEIRKSFINSSKEVQIGWTEDNRKTR